MAGAMSSSAYGPGQPGNQNWLSQGPHGDTYIDPNGYINSWDATHQTYLNSGRQDQGFLNNRQQQADNARQAQIDAENSRRSAAHDAAFDALRNQITQAYSGPAAMIGAGPGATPEDHSSYDSSPDAQAANATYGAAKDKVGQQTTGALKGLQNQLAARGLSGSGLESAGYGKIYAGGASDLSASVRQQATEDAGHEREFYDTQRAGNRQTQQFNADLGERQQEAAAQQRSSALQSLLSVVSRY